MTTKTPGGRITGAVALTCEAQEAMQEGDAVHLVGPYEVELADGTKPILGHVSVEPKGRVGHDFPADIVPGPVTVEARGYSVAKVTAGAAVGAGNDVKPSSTGKRYVVDADGPTVARCGIALTTAAANGDPIDVLFN